MIDVSASVTDDEIVALEEKDYRIRFNEKDFRELPEDVIEKLSNAMLSPEYTAQPPEWRAMLEQRYVRARQELQAATTPPPPAQPTGKPAQAPQGGQPVGKAPIAGTIKPQQLPAQVA